MIEPVVQLKGIDLLERGSICRRCAQAVLAKLPQHIADRELKVIASELGSGEQCLQAEVLKNSRGPGSCVAIEIESDAVTEVFTDFGQPGAPAEVVAGQVAKPCSHYLNADNVSVGEHLADQLLLLLALAGPGSCRTLPLSRHTTIHIELIEQFLEIKVEVQPQGDSVLVNVGR